MIHARAVFTPRGDLGRFIESKVTPAVKASVEAACGLIEETAKGYCPVDTGALRDSISTEIEETGKSIVGHVGPHTDYAEYVEFGTRFMAAQPFMRPAFDENKNSIKELFQSNLGVSLGR